MNKINIFLLLLVSVLFTPKLFAEDSALKITPLLKTTLSSDLEMEANVMKAELAPKGSTGLHTHPGDEYATVLSGSVEIHSAGQITKIVNAGESYHNPANFVHETINTGDTPALILATFITKKGQPIVIPQSKGGAK